MCVVREVERGRFGHDSPCAYVHACMVMEVGARLTVCVCACMVRVSERGRLHEGNSPCLYIRHVGMHVC